MQFNIKDKKSKYLKALEDQHSKTKRLVIQDLPPLYVYHRTAFYNHPEKIPVSPAV